ncbi:hypothetical protein N7510_007069 [Penicillium lagena]|uniref:uncharacterized protein n=1 Tax=Penicillium lagena TaxID=94218 RepID=UPI00253FB124|nr:uncharacterized protein N7510_007069 [Penicillium lagena]KAJ5610350.1 hypothetical protein N7510_007069 [Penicillium lagena]
MDPEASERLRKLQLVSQPNESPPAPEPWYTHSTTHQADLGTARRERISTADDPRRQASVHLAYIETTRESNISGTKAQRLAEENRVQLEEWKTMSSFILSAMAITRCQRSPPVVGVVSWELEDADFLTGKKPFGQLLLLHCLQTHTKQDLPELRTMELPPAHIHVPPMPQLHRPIWTLLLTPITMLCLALIAVRDLSEKLVAKNAVLVSDPGIAERHSTDTYPQRAGDQSQCPDARDLRMYFMFLNPVLPF